MNQIKLVDASSGFKNFLKEKGHSTSTIVAYGKDIEQLVSFLGELQKHDVNNVSNEDIEAFLAKINKD